MSFNRLSSTDNTTWFASLNNNNNTSWQQQQQRPPPPPPIAGPSSTPSFTPSPGDLGLCLSSSSSTMHHQAMGNWQSPFAQLQTQQPLPLFPIPSLQQQQHHQRGLPPPHPFPPRQQQSQPRPPQCGQQQQQPFLAQAVNSSSSSSPPFSLAQPQLHQLPHSQQQPTPPDHTVCREMLSSFSQRFELAIDGMSSTQEQQTLSSGDSQHQQHQQPTFTHPSFLSPASSHNLQPSLQMNLNTGQSVVKGAASSTYMSAPVAQVDISIPIFEFHNATAPQLQFGSTPSLTREFQQLRVPIEASTTMEKENSNEVQRKQPFNSVLATFSSSAIDASQSMPALIVSPSSTQPSQPHPTNVLPYCMRCSQPAQMKAIPAHRVAAVPLDMIQPMTMNETQEICALLNEHAAMDSEIDLLLRQVNAYEERKFTEQVTWHQQEEKRRITQRVLRTTTTTAASKKRNANSTQSKGEGKEENGAATSFFESNQHKAKKPKLNHSSSTPASTSLIDSAAVLPPMPSTESIIQHMKSSISNTVTTAKQVSMLMKSVVEEEKNGEERKQGGGMAVAAAAAASSSNSSSIPTVTQYKAAAFSVASSRKPPAATTSSSFTSKKKKPSSSSSTTGPHKKNEYRCGFINKNTGAKCTLELTDVYGRREHIKMAHRASALRKRREQHASECENYAHLSLLLVFSSIPCTKTAYCAFIADNQAELDRHVCGQIPAFERTKKKAKKY